MKSFEELAAEVDAKECKNCRGGFRCFNEKSPCYLYHCGEYPGTGKFESVTKKSAAERKNGKI